MSEYEQSRPSMTRSAVPGISPFFIVRNVAAATSFYRDMLGFDITHQQPDHEPFFAIVCRDGAMIFIKSAGEEPLPNCKRNPAARWDAYV
jgi:catechol 2,3-dioxygenase-like lactoylglutathione lyase family enzyme